MRLIDADAYSAEMKDRQEAAWKWRNEAIAEEDEVKLARAEGAYTAFTEAKLTMDKHIINPWHRAELEEPTKAGWYLVMDVDGDFNVDEWHNTFGWQFVTPSDADRITYWMPIEWMPIEPPKEDA